MLFNFECIQMKQLAPKFDNDLLPKHSRAIRIFEWWHSIRSHDTSICLIVNWTFKMFSITEKNAHTKKNQQHKPIRRKCLSNVVIAVIVQLLFQFPCGKKSVSKEKRRQWREFLLATMQTGMETVRQKCWPKGKSSKHTQPQTSFCQSGSAEYWF